MLLPNVKHSIDRSSDNCIEALCYKYNWYLEIYIHFNSQWKADGHINPYSIIYFKIALQVYFNKAPELIENILKYLSKGIIGLHIPMLQYLKSPFKFKNPP